MKFFIKNILFSLVLFSILSAADKKYSIKSTSIETKIYENGIVSFSEERLFSFQGKYSFVYKIIPKRGYDRLFNIQISVDDVPFLNEDSKKPGAFLIQERKSSYKIIIYHNSVDEDRLFNIEYSLDNPFTIGPDDTQFYWTYLSDEWDKKPGKLFISQTFIGDIDESKITIKQELPLRSKRLSSELKDKSYIFNSNNFTSNTKMRLKTIFPTSFLTNSSINNKDFSLAKLEEKNRNKELVQYFIGFLVLFSLTSFISYFRRNLKKFKLDIDENQQFKSFPSDHHPVVINALIYRELTLGPTGSGILSTLFELGSLKKLSIEVIEKGKWIFKSKRLKVTIHNTDMDEVQSSFARLLLTRLRKFGKKTTFKDVFSEFQMRSYKWKKLKTEELSRNGWVDTSGSDEKYRLSIIQFLIMNIIVALSIIFETFIGLLSVLPSIFLLITLFGSRLTKEGQLIYNQWGLFIHQLSENKIDVKHFDPELLLQYCIALGVQPDSLKKVIKNVEDYHDSSYVWMYHGSNSDIGSVASIVSDIATTGTTVSAAYGGDGAGGGAGGGGGGAGGGGGGGAG